MATTELMEGEILADGIASIPLGAFPSEITIPLPSDTSSPVEYAEAIGEVYLSYSKRKYRKSTGHYQTPSSIAKFMAESCLYTEPYLRVLDPGSGTGILSAAVCEKAGKSNTVKRLHIDAYETDPLLAGLTSLVLGFSCSWLAERDVVFTFDVRQSDFVLENAAVLQQASEHNRRQVGVAGADYNLVISNPPYFKIRKDDPRAVAWPSVVHGQPNIYALFMSISAELLSESGRLVYIVPRSFASGPYFRKFREDFFQRVAPVAIHLFESRKDVFKNQTVLQETLVITARGRIESETLDEMQVLISHSKAASDIGDRKRLVVDFDSVLDRTNENRELSIPLCPQDLELVRALQTWPNTLRSLGLEISTGRVVPFRATRFLSQEASKGSAAPLLWMRHVRPMRTMWPAEAMLKPQWIIATPMSKKLLIEDSNYVILRRFSAKEEKRRLIAAPLLRKTLNANLIGLENHLNYIRGVSSEMDDELTYGLSALLNSSLLDRYFRISSGNTQVSATELRAMPLPAEDNIRSIGKGIQARLDSENCLPELDSLVSQTLGLSPEPS